MSNYKDKYIKYKVKYTGLLKKITSQYGGQVSNLEAMLVLDKTNNNEITDRLKDIFMDIYRYNHENLCSKSIYTKDNKDVNIVVRIPSVAKNVVDLANDVTDAADFNFSFFQRMIDLRTITKRFNHNEIKTVFNGIEDQFYSILKSKGIFTQSPSYRIRIFSALMALKTITESSYGQLQKILSVPNKDEILFTRLVKARGILATCDFEQKYKKCTDYIKERGPENFTYIDIVAMYRGL